jgi:catalase
MPLPSDEKLLQLSDEVLQQFETLFGKHPGFRPAHAKGVLLTGTFTPKPEAAALTRAPHANRPSTSVTVRFSNGTGIPVIPDNNPNANPHGLAVRFHLADRVHTDIVSHSTDGFPVRTGQEFLEMLRAIAATAPGQPSPTAIEQFMGAHPAALAYVQTPKPSPASFATEAYFGVTALRFVNKEGAARFGRFRIVPAAGVEHLSDAAAQANGPDYLLEDIASRVAAGPVRFEIQVQVAADGDVTDDATVHWPANRPLVPFGTLALTSTVADDAAQQRHLIWDPIPRVDGIEPSNDPLLELRAAVYLISGRRRREAEQVRTASPA